MNSAGVVPMPVTKRWKWRRGLLVLVLLAVGAWLFQAQPLPHMRLADGGEFRVVKVVYGTEQDHYLHGAPKFFFTFWERMPGWLQRVVPYPWTGLSGEIPRGAGISIWWAWFDPETGRPELGPSGDGVMTLDSGERVPFPYPNPADDYRQILIPNPPRDSQWLHFSVPVNELEKPTEFTIRNPAWRH
jgi:hypothetical protein